MAGGDAEKGRGGAPQKHAEEVYEELAGAEADVRWERIKRKNVLTRCARAGGAGMHA